MLIHPGRLTWNIIIEVWKIIFLSKWVVCMFHVNLPGCKGPRCKLRGVFVACFFLRGEDKKKITTSTLPTCSNLINFYSSGPEVYSWSSHEVPLVLGPQFFLTPTGPKKNAFDKDFTSCFLHGLISSHIGILFVSHASGPKWLHPCHFHFF